MHIRTFVRTAAAAGALAASLFSLTPALAAADTAGADIARGAMPPPPAMPDAPPPPQLPDPRPEWREPPPRPIGPAPVMMQVDPRARDGWLAECRRRMDVYYSSGWDDDHGWKRHRRHHSDREVRNMGHDYCEVYFDDYYRHYSQAGYAYGQPMMMRTVAPAAPAAQNCVTEERVSYVPVRSRYIPRRPAYKRVPDKRVRVN